MRQVVTLAAVRRHRWGVSEVDLEGAYQKWAGELIGYATALIGPGAAADVVADVFANLIAAGPSTWDAVGDPRGYLFRCVLNASRMHGRSTGRRTAREQIAMRLLTTNRSPMFDGPESDGRVREAFGSLSVQQQAVIYHTYWDDLAPALTAELMGVSVGTVKRQLARARSKMRKVMS